MSEAREALLPDERVVWSGAPDWESAPRPKPLWRRKAEHAAWMIFFAALAAGMIGIGVQAATHPFARNALGFIVVLIGIGEVIATVTFFDFTDAQRRSPNETYTITDRRILVEGAPAVKRISIIDGVMMVSVTENGKASDLTVGYGNGEESYVVLRGLKDAAAAEKIILERFIRKRDMK